MYSSESKRDTYLNIDFKALKHNLRTIISRLQGTRPIAVVKADAYGHGAVKISRKLKQMGINRFAVSNLDEAIELRENGINDSILILGPIPEKFFHLLDQHHLTPTISDTDYGKLLLQHKIIQQPAQIKIDTGMGRLGIPYSEALPSIINFLEQGLPIEGIFSHFPSADSDPDFTDKQIHQMLKLIQSLYDKKIRFKSIHIANSYAIFRNKLSVSPPFSWVRPGLGLYGYVPGYNLKEMINLKSSVAVIKKLSKGDSVSYLRSYKVENENEWIAVLPIGYADGLPVSLSNKGFVSIKGQQFPIVGRICMDYTMVSLGTTPTNIQRNDEATIIGKNAMSVEHFSKLTGKIPYEVTCGISKRVPRNYIE